MIKIEWAQWTLYFFLYAFAGWVWESAYVSVLSQQWVNRGLSAWPVYPNLWIRCAADPDDDIFCAASCGCGLFCWHDRSNDPGIWDWHRAGSVVSYPALGLLSCGLELPGIYFGDFLRFLGGFGCGTGYMDPSVFFFHHTDMACMGFGYRVPTAFDSGRSGLDFIDLGEHCEPE